MIMMQTNDRRLIKEFKEKMIKKHIHRVHPLLNVLLGSRNGRLTASNFGEISNRRVTTPPDRLVRDLFQYKVRPSVLYQCKVGLL